MRTYIIIKTQFSATHCWPECPIEDVAYLKNPHRHVFHVKLKIAVFHSDRDVEFINAKNQLNQTLQENWENTDLGSLSCEMIAEHLMKFFPNTVYVEVLEDGENGACIEI